MTNAQIKQFCKLSVEGLNLLKVAIPQMGISARSYHRVLKLARTIADLDDSEIIRTKHISESLTTE